MQSTAIHLLAQPFCVFFYTGTGKAILAACSQIQFDLLPDIFIERQNSFVLHLRKIHRQAHPLVKSKQNDGGGSTAATLT